MFCTTHDAPDIDTNSEIRVERGERRRVGGVRGRKGIQHVYVYVMKNA